MDEAVTVVEWGEGLVEGLADDRLHLHIERPHGAADADPGPDGSPDDAPDDAVDVPRRVTITGVGARWDGVALAAAATAPVSGAGA
jgi:tRNA threonylcarbamoyladenosine biosynthesis protein TsaE